MFDLDVVSGEIWTCAVPLLHGEGETAVTATLEAPDGVSARPVSAQAFEHLTFVHIYREKQGL